MGEAAPTWRWITVVPNLLSVARLGVAAFFPFAATTWRLPLAIFAGASDWLDGFVARRFEAKSVSGALLDAIADKLFVLSVLVTLVVAGDVRWWQVLLVISRDLVVAMTALYAAVTADWGRFRQMRPRATGKIATLLVFTWFVALLAPGSWTWFRAVAPVLFVCTAIASVGAGGEYLVRFVRALIARAAARRADA